MRRLNSPALLIASCPVIASATYSRSVGSTASLIASSSSISSSSMCSRPAVSTMTTSKPLLRASASAPVARRTGSISPAGSCTRTPACFADDRQLLDRRRAPHVGRHEQRVLALLRQPPSQLARGRRLARALQAEQQDDARPRRRRRQPALRVAEERQHLVAHDPDDLLRRRQAPQDLLIDRPVAHAIDERLDDLEVDVRLEQRHPDFAERGLDRLLGEPGLAAKRLEDVLQAVAERVEHGFPGRPLRGPQRSTT